MAKTESVALPGQTSTGPRTRKLTKKQAKAKAKKEARQRQPIIGSFRLIWQVFGIFKRYWKPLGGIVLVYLILNIVFASGISNISSSFDTIKSDLNAQGGPQLWSAAGGFAGLLSTAGAASSATGSALQAMLFVIESLVIIWALRHLLADQPVTVKLSYYRSMTPLIPFLLVIVVIIIQLLPVTIGGAALAAVATSVFTNAAVATAAAAIAFVLLAAWSLYMVCASVFGLYIVTLPDMQPRQALRSARELVAFRRLVVIRKILFLPIFLFVVIGAITVPLILYAPVVVPWVFYVLSMLAILFIHSYMYSLYRSLLE